MITLMPKLTETRLAQLHQNAQRLLDARLHGVALTAFPGELPCSLQEAYLSQDHAIQKRGGIIAGWKVGFIAPERRDAEGDERVLGPIFADLVAQADHEATLPWRFIAGGFAAVEAEYVLRLGSEVNAQTVFYDEALQEVVASVHVGVELAGSALQPINKIGPMAVASDFGNNNGLILGPEIPLDPRTLARSESWTALRARTLINGHEVGLGGAGSVPGTPWRAFTFALKRLVQRGYNLPAGTLIATGASTGIHDVVHGDGATLEFWSDHDPARRIQMRCDISQWSATA